MQKVMMTLPEDLLEEITHAAEQSNQNRSEFIRTALRAYLDHIKRKDLELLMAEGYLAMAREDQADATAYLKATRHLREDT